MSKTATLSEELWVVHGQVVQLKVVDSAQRRLRQS
jgi:hypothetical protein